MTNAGFRLSQPLTLFAGLTLDRVSPSDVDRLLDCAVQLPDGGPLGDEGVPRSIRTCREFRRWLPAANEPDLYAPRDVPFFKAHWFLRALAEARPPRRSFIDWPRVGVADLALHDLHNFPALAHDVFIIRVEDSRHWTLQDLVDLGEATVRSVGSNRLHAALCHSDDLADMVLEEVLRADFEGGGVEEVLVFLDLLQGAAKFRTDVMFHYSMILTRDAPDAPFRAFGCDWFDDPDR